MVDVLIPTRDRTEALAVTLTSLCFQDYRDFAVIIANQGDRKQLDADPSLACALRLLTVRGHRVRVLDNFPRRGMAQQRQFLLDHSNAPYCLFLDDDVILESFVIRNLLQVLIEQGCGFAGNAVIGLSYAQEYRPSEQRIAFWDGYVQPEAVEPGDVAWQRHVLHNAANVWHVQQRLGVSPDKPRAYKVAWIGGCVLYDAKKLREVGGFSFWQELPREHSGEDVLAQLRVMRRFGGCGVLPSGAYHQEWPTTLTNRKVDAPLCLPI